MLYRTFGVRVDEAFELLRTYARNHGLRLTAGRRDVLGDQRAMARLVAAART